MTAEHLHSARPPELSSRTLPIPNLPRPTLCQQPAVLTFSTNPVVVVRIRQFGINLALLAAIEILRTPFVLAQTAAPFSNPSFKEQIQNKPAISARISVDCCRSLLWMQGFMPQKLHSSCREHQHAEKNQSVAPTLYVGCSVCSLPIVNRNLNDL